ncbi:MAG: hypothetical protein WCY18_01775 [Methanofastidiosum sp.]
MINKIKKHMFRRTLVSTSHRKLDNYLNDIKNKIIYGTSGPLYAERIWIDPSCCKKAILLDISISGRVIEGNWPPNSKINVTPVEDLIKIKACIDHWVNGIPWENTGIYEHMEDLIKSYGEYDGCKNIIERILINFGSIPAIG